MDLTVIIINWNSLDYLEKCLRTIYLVNDRDDLEVIVFDNASYDGSKEMVEKDFPGVVFYQSHENLGFGQANNVAARMASNQMLLFLNPDTELVDHAISGIYNTLNEQKEIGMAGCVLLNSDGTIQDSSVLAYPTILNQILDSRILRNVFPSWSLWKNNVLFSDDQGLPEVEALSGAFLMVRKDIFNEIGGFDPAFFMYAEDLDISLKIRQAGYKVVLDKRYRVIHHGGGSTAHKQRSQFSNVMMRKSIYKFLRKHRGPYSAITYKIAMGVTAVIRLFILWISLPVQWMRNRDIATASISKWNSILKWSLAREDWSENAPYYESINNHQPPYYDV